MNKWSRAAVLLVAGALAYGVAHSAAQGATTDLLKSLRWRNIGPLRGGRSIAVAGSAARPLEYYFGAVGGGLWKTEDGGTSWDPVSDAFFRTSRGWAVH